MLVPAGYLVDPALGLWVRWQRVNHNNNNTVAYKKQHESTQVPSKFAEDPQLGIWVGTQRVAYNKLKLLKEKKRGTSKFRRFCMGCMGK